MQSPNDSEFVSDTSFIKRANERIAALERCRQDTSAFPQLDQWDAEARAYLRRRLRGYAEAFLKFCLSYEPRIYSGMVDSLRSAEAQHTEGVVALPIRGLQTLRKTLLTQALFKVAELSPVASTLSRGGIETFADLEEAGRDRLLSIGVTLGEIEMLDRACASGGLRMKAAQELVTSVGPVGPNVSRFSNTCS